MKQMIRYLYEYENGIRVRNTGFMKMEKQGDRCMIQMHGKGLDFGAEKKLRVYVFYVRDGQCIGVPQGVMEDVSPVMNWILRFGKEDMGGAEAFEMAAGVVLQNAEGRKYAAVWTDVSVNIEAMQEADEISLEDPRADRRGNETDGRNTEAEREDETAGRDEESGRDREPGWDAESVRGRTAGRDEESGRDKAEGTEDGQEESPRESLIEHVERMVEKQEVQPVMEEEVEAYIPPRTRTYEKIQRHDISRLPRREWRLANNSFLLHGFYNYHHLLFIKEDDNSWIGVPGIYHEKERAAARAFGFPQFHRITDADIELSGEEKNTYDDFGYWCRQVES